MEMLSLRLLAEIYQEQLAMLGTVSPADLVRALAVLGSLFFVLCIFIDLMSLYFYISRIRLGYGPSGVPLVSWFIYVLGTVIAKWWTALIVLTTFHICCHFLIPWLYGRRHDRGKGKLKRKGVEIEE